MHSFTTSKKKKSKKVINYSNVFVFSTVDIIQIKSLLLLSVEQIASSFSYLLAFFIFLGQKKTIFALQRRPLKKGKEITYNTIDPNF